MKAQKLNQRQARQLLYLSRFDFMLKHVAGKSMGRADSLSRRVDWAEGVEKDNENQVMLKEEQLEVRAMEQLVEGLEEEIVKKIKKVRDKDEEVIKAVEEMKKAEVSQNSFSLYLHNQWTTFHKLSYTRKPKMRAICTYIEYTQVITNNQDIKLSVTIRFFSYYLISSQINSYN